MSIESPRDFVFLREPPQIIENYHRNDFPQKRPSIDLFFSGERRVKVIGISKQEIREERRALGGLIRDVLDCERVATLIDRVISRGLGTEELRQWKTEKLSMLKGIMTKGKLKKVLGNTIYYKLEESIQWQRQIPKTKVKELRWLIQCYLDNLAKEQRPFFTQQEAQGLLEQFQEERDYLIEERLFQRLIPLIKMPLHQCPRLEQIRKALLDYFHFEDLAASVSVRMWREFRRIKTLLSDQTEQKINNLGEDLEKSKTVKEMEDIRKREDLGEDLKRGNTLKEKANILKKYSPRTFPWKEKAFFDFFELMIFTSNELLLSSPEEKKEEDILQELRATALKVLDSICWDLGLTIQF